MKTPKNTPTPPIEEALIALGGILASEEAPCPSEIGEEIEDVIVALEEAKRTRDELVEAARNCVDVVTEDYVDRGDCGLWSKVGSALRKLEVVLTKIEGGAK